MGEQPDTTARECPFCGESMVAEFVWIDGFGDRALAWAAGEVEPKERWFVGRKADATFLKPPLFMARTRYPATRAYRCPTCGGVSIRLSLEEKDA